MALWNLLVKLYRLVVVSRRNIDHIPIVWSREGSRKSSSDAKVTFQTRIWLTKIQHYDNHSKALLKLSRLVVPSSSFSSNNKRSFALLHNQPRTISSFQARARVQTNAVAVRFRMHSCPCRSRDCKLLYHMAVVNSRCLYLPIYQPCLLLSEARVDYKILEKQEWERRSRCDISMRKLVKRWAGVGRQKQEANRAANPRSNRQLSNNNTSISNTDTPTLNRGDHSVIRIKIIQVSPEERGPARFIFISLSREE